MPVITHLSALEILDSRGRPTVQARCGVDGAAPVAASVPAGASTGRAEAAELRDGDPTRYRGLGCRKAVASIEGEIAAAVLGNRFENQEELDAALLRLDGTIDRGHLGANSILAVSLSFARAVSRHAGVPLYSYFGGLLDTVSNGSSQDPAPGAWKTPDQKSPPPNRTLAQETGRLPRPMINLFSGGKHAGAQVSIQDVLIVPVSASSIDEVLVTAFDIYASAAALCARRYGTRTLVADEGGLAPPFPNSETMLSDAVAAIESAGYLPGEEVALAIDVAASHFHQDGRYLLDGKELTAAKMIERIAEWAGRYPILSVEDGLAEDDWDNWPRLRARLGNSTSTLGDDLLCTQTQRIVRAAESGAANALLLKVNQVGTLTEAVEANRAARSAGWRVTVSARSGETEDDWLADLAVGWGAEHIKIGSITRSERLAKYNRLLAIEAGRDWPVSR